VSKSLRPRGCALTKGLAPIHDAMRRGPCGMVGHGWNGSGWPVEHGRVAME